MNSINSNYSNMRLVGLASGLDTDSIIQQLMYAERMPMTKLEQQRTETQWKQEAYRDFTNALRGFKEKFFDITKQSSYLLSENSFKTFPLFPHQMSILQHVEQRQLRQGIILLRLNS